MNTVALLGKFAPGAVFLALVLASLSGACYALLIPVVLASTQELQGLQYELQEPTPAFGLQISDPRLASLFALLCVAVFVMRTTSQVVLTRVSVALTREIRSELYCAILACPIRVLEQFGSPKVIAALTTDVARIVAGAGVAPPLLVSVVTVIGMLLYTWVLKAEIFYALGVALLFGGISFQVVAVRSRKHFAHARQSMDDLQESVQALVLGAKELRLSRQKRTSFLEEKLLATETQLKCSNEKAYSIAAMAKNYGDLLAFMVMGGIAFIGINYYQVSTPQLVAVLMVVIYMAAPMGEILASMPVLMQAAISHTRMATLLVELEDDGCVDSNVAPPEWKELSFRDVTFAYDRHGGFSVGPITLAFRKGEITFVIGGNGSGKSTFSKIATLHYYPTEGDVFFDDVRIGKDNINSYRQCVACIYSDYHLLASLYGVNTNDNDVKPEIDKLLLEFGLHEKVTFEAGRFSTLQLSDGQRRRLAMLVAIVEDKEFYLFDEWAADQDETYRKFYYERILPMLKARGKAVVAISHDDRYFHLADQVIKFDGGLASIVLPDGRRAMSEYHSRGQIRV